MNHAESILERAKPSARSTKSDGMRFIYKVEFSGNSRDLLFPLTNSEFDAFVNTEDYWLIALGCALAGVPFIQEGLDQNYIFPYDPKLKDQLIKIFKLFPEKTGDQKNSELQYSKITALLNEAFAAYPQAALLYCCRLSKANPYGFGVFNKFFPEIDKIAETDINSDLIESEKVLQIRSANDQPLVAFVHSFSKEKNATKRLGLLVVDFISANPEYFDQLAETSYLETVILLLIKLKNILSLAIKSPRNKNNLINTKKTTELQDNNPILHQELIFLSKQYSQRHLEQLESKQRTDARVAKMKATNEKKLRTKEHLAVNPEKFGLKINYMITDMMHKIDPECRSIAFIDIAEVVNKPEKYQKMLKEVILTSAKSCGYPVDEREIWAITIKDQDWIERISKPADRHEARATLRSQETLLRNSHLKFMLDENVQELVLNTLPQHVAIPHYIIDGVAYPAWDRGNDRLVQKEKPEIINPAPFLYHVEKLFRWDSLLNYKAILTIPGTFIDRAMQLNQKSAKRVIPFLDHAMARWLIKPWTELDSKQYDGQLKNNSCEPPPIDVDLIIVCEYDEDPGIIANQAARKHSLQVIGGYLNSFIMNVAYGFMAKFNPKERMIHQTHWVANTKKCLLQALNCFTVNTSGKSSSSKTLISSLIGFQRLRTLGFGINSHNEYKDTKIFSLTFLDLLNSLQYYGEAGYGFQKPGDEKRMNVINFTSLESAFPRRNPLALWHILRTFQDLFSHNQAIILPHNLPISFQMSEQKNYNILKLAKKGMEEFRHILEERLNDLRVIYKEFPSDHHRGDMQLELLNFAHKIIATSPHLFLTLCSDENIRNTQFQIDGMNIDKLYPFLQTIKKDKKLWNLVLESTTTTEIESGESQEHYLARIIWQFPIARAYISQYIEKAFFKSPIAIGERLVLQRLKKKHTPREQKHHNLALLSPRMGFFVNNRSKWRMFINEMKKNTDLKENIMSREYWHNLFDQLTNSDSTRHSATKFENDIYDYLDMMWCFLVEEWQTFDTETLKFMAANEAIEVEKLCKINVKNDLDFKTSPDENQYIVRGEERRLRMKKYLIKELIEQILLKELDIQSNPMMSRGQDAKRRRYFILRRNNNIQFEAIQDEIYKLAKEIENGNVPDYMYDSKPRDNDGIGADRINALAKIILIDPELIEGFDLINVQEQ